MYIARGNKRVDPWPFGQLDRLPCPGYILFIGTAQPGNYRDISILVHFVPDNIGNLFHGIKIIGAGDGKPGLDDIDAELGEIAGYFEFFGTGQCGPRGLLSVAQGGVEDAYVVGIGNVAGDVFRTRTAFVEFRDGGGFGDGRAEMTARSKTALMNDAAPAAAGMDDGSLGVEIVPSMSWSEG